MAWPYVFGSLSGNVPANYLDANFNAAVLQTDFDALEVIVLAYPSNAVPLFAVAGGLAGVATTLSRADHQHPPQDATVNLQVGTTYTVQTTDNGKVVELSNAGTITVTVPNSLPQGFNCLFTQAGAGQVTFVADSGATQRQRQSFTKTAGQWAIVSMYVRANVGGTSAEYVLAGDMSA